MKASIEFRDHENFLANLPFDSFAALLQDKVVLDFGSGYGGRTAWLAQYAKEVVGIEIHSAQVAAGAAFCRSRDIANTRFALGASRDIEFPDNHFDLIISFDVIEHVEHPVETIGAMYRVLKPGGQAIVIFTPYLGAFSHHLNYITLVPGLHWVFEPSNIIAAVNDLLLHDSHFQGLIRPQPAPPQSFNGKRQTLPGLNGIVKREYIEIVRNAGFKIEYIRSTPLLEKFRALGSPGAAANRWLNHIPGCDELFSHNLVSILRK